MSLGLVAYDGSSDESEDSNEKAASGNLIGPSSAIELDEWESPGFCAHPTSLNLPPPKMSNPDVTSKTVTTNSDGSAQKITATDRLNFTEIPVPLASRQADSGNTVGEDDEEDEPELIIQPTQSEIALREKLPEKRKTVKIAALSFPLIPDSDSDEDERPEAGKVKRPKMASSLQNKTGLFALLPPPNMASSSLLFAPKSLKSAIAPMKQIAPIKEQKTASHPLLPHCISRNSTSASTDLSHPLQTKHVTLNNSVMPKQTGNSSSDEEDGSGVNFFSLDSRDVLHTSAILSEHSGLSGEPIVAGHSILASHNRLPPSASATRSVAAENALYSGPWTNLRTEDELNDDLYASSSSTGVTSSVLEEESYLPDDNEAEHERLLLNPENDLCFQDEQFLRIAGRRNRGCEINFIDIRAADAPSDVELTKNITEEVDKAPSRNKNDGPTSQQKRKHQITYLAHQAKEREFQLKNQWADNKTVKRQAQSKYGF